MKKTIDLAKYMKDGAKFIIGRENGTLARTKERLNELIKKVEMKEYDYIEVIISKETYGVVSSFILGFFAGIKSVLSTKEKFYEVFDFSSLQLEIQKQIEEEIEYIYTR